MCPFHFRERKYARGGEREGEGAGERGEGFLFMQTCAGKYAYVLIVTPLHCRQRYVIGATGITLAFYFTGAAGRKHLTSLHGGIGVGIFGLLTIQIVVAATRPKPSSYTGESEAWRYWNVGIGWFNITGAVAVIALGIQHLPSVVENDKEAKIWSADQKDFNFAAIIYGGVMGLVLLAYGVSAYCRSRQTIRSYSMGPQYVAGEGYYYEND